jgi:hypothetical protein
MPEDVLSVCEQQWLITGWEIFIFSKGRRKDVGIKVGGGKLRP